MSIAIRFTCPELRTLLVPLVWGFLVTNRFGLCMLQ